MQHVVVVGLGDLAVEAGVVAGVLEVVEQLLGLVLEAQDDHVGADLAVGEQRAALADALDDRVAVRAGRRVADRFAHPLLEHRRHRVLDPLRLLVDLVPGDVQHVGEEALDHPVAADDVGGALAAVLGEGERFVLVALDVAVLDQPADHFVDGRRRQLHRAGDVGTGHRQARLVDPEHRLEVLLLRHGCLLGCHLVLLLGAPNQDQLNISEFLTAIQNSLRPPLATLPGRPLVALLLWSALDAHGGTPEPTAGDHLSHGAVVLDSALLVFREGLETILVLAAVTASMVGATEVYRRPIAIGAGTGFLASVATWFLAAWVLGSSAAAGWRCRRRPGCSR